MKKLEWNPLYGSVLAITAITLISIGLVAVGLHAVGSKPLTPFNFKAKECKVYTLLNFIVVQYESKYSFNNK